MALIYKTRFLLRVPVYKCSVRSIYLPVDPGQVLATGKTIKCTLLPCDGIGPELVKCVEDVFHTLNVPVQFEPFPFSEVNSESSAPLDAVVRSIKKNGVCLKGVLEVPGYGHTGELKSLNIKLRTELDLYANVVHVQTLADVKTRHKNVNFVVCREYTEGEYSALEHVSVDGVVECLKIITTAKSRRIAKFAFDFATFNKREKVLAIHKANIMKMGDGVFLKGCNDIAKFYPNIKYEKMIVDNCTMQLVSRPQQFDVLVLPNLYGNIVDNLGVGLIGGAGIVPSASYSSDCVVFEPAARHVYHAAVGKNIANPTAMLLCGCLLLRHVRLFRFAKIIREAVRKTLVNKVLTRDLGGTNSTSEFMDEVKRNLDTK